MIQAINTMALQTLTVLGPFLSNIHQNWCILGSTGLVLHGIETKAEGIDILTEAAGARKLSFLLAGFNKTSLPREESSVMSDEGTEYLIGGTSVKVLTNLKVKVNEGWVRILELIHKIEFCEYNGYWLALPSLADQLKIFRLSGREKDMKEAEKISQFLSR